MRIIITAVVASFLASALAAATLNVTTVGTLPLAEGTQRVVNGTLALPGEGFWTLAETQSADTPVEIFLEVPEALQGHAGGRRMQKVATNRNLQRGRQHLSSLYWIVRQYANTNEATGPASLDLLDHDTIERIQTAPWRDPYRQTEGPFVFLLPGVPFHFPDAERHFVPRDRREKLAFELRPFVDDGKHWVLYTDGSIERESIDLALIREHAQTIRPVTSEPDRQRPPARNQNYMLTAVLTPQTPASFTVQVQNHMSGERQEAIWQPDINVPADPALQQQLARLRANQWQFLTSITQSDLLAAWQQDDREGNRQRPPSASLFGLLGGRPAIEETLQMGLLRNAPDTGERTIRMDTIEGVTVASHPYATMLGQTNVSAPDLLAAVPADHLVLYVPQPRAMLSFLDGGADFMANLGSASIGRSIRYDLKDRYLARLGMHPDWIEQVLKSGIIREMALFAPDLFFIDGTDITVVARVARPALLTSLLKMIQVRELGTEATMVRTPAGQQTFWAMQGDLLFVSSSASEIALALRLHQEPAASLAQSAEFQYMLTKVPLQSSTRMLLYFSDPFIRHLVSPSLKIGQLRRALARARMEQVTALALRAHLDGFNTVDMADLRRQGYLPEDVPSSDIRLQADGRAISDTYGTLADPVALSEIPINFATAAEVSAYRTYLDNYNRFWRQFFDPIAIRIDDTEDGGLEMTTFILPLIDNSLYDSIKTFLAHADAPSLRVPAPEPEPVLLLSLQMTESAWTQVAEGLSELFTRYIFLSPAAIDDLGPALHFAIYDADPVIALGSGDVFGALGGGTEFFRQGQMFAIPIALSVLTRPCAFIVETRDAARTARFLTQAATAALQKRARRNREFDAGFYQIGNENAWVYTFSVFGMIHLRFGITIEGDYVVVRNIPWSRSDRIANINDSPLPTARLALHPAACVQQLPGLHAAAMETARQASLEGIGRLYPIMLAHKLSVTEALQAHAKWFGFRPIHPGQETWVGDARTLHSPVYGSATRQQQPPYDPDQPAFGLLHTVERLNVSMAFEDDGLRSILQWKLRE